MVISTLILRIKERALGVVEVESRNMKTKQSRLFRKWIAVIATLWLGGCGYYPPINVKVIDAETDQPIEGAVLLAQWTIPSGMMGFNASKNFKVVQTVSDNDGKMRVEGVRKPGVNKPKVTVYKKGYVAWNSRIIFPNFARRKDFAWRNGYVFKLQRFKPQYTHREHALFIGSTYSSGVGDGPFRRAWYWEAGLK